MISRFSCLVVLATTLGGCSLTGGETTGSVSPSAAAVAATPQKLSESEWRQEMLRWKPIYDADEGNADAAIQYARALRAIGQKGQASAVLQQAAIRNPNDQAVLGAYGRALADNGQLTQALDVLEKAHDPDKPDWKILSVQGAVLDQLGRPDEAQKYYESSLRLHPDDPMTMSNYGLSLALSKRLKEAEEVLRKAVAMPDAQPKVRQNLVLVLGLQGKFDEAERIAKQDQSPEQARANMAALKGMMSQSNSWKMLKQSEQGGT